jgi:WD40 repeat protein
MILSGTTARLWGLDSEPAGTRLLRAQNIDPYELTDDNKTLLTVNDGSYFQLWNTETATAITEPIPLQAQVRLATISADGKRAATDTDDGRLQLWQAGKSQPIASIAVNVDAQTMALSRDGSLVARASFNLATIWNGSTYPRELHGHTDNIIDIALTNEFVITGSADKTARIWTAATAETLHVLSHDDAVRAVAISDDGHHALTGGKDGAVRLWDVKSGSRLAEMRVKEPIRRIKFSSDGTACAILTASWLYIAKVKDETLIYETGIVIADPWWPKFNLSGDGTKLRFAYLFGGNAVQL